MQSFVDQFVKPLEWAASGKASLEVAAVGAGVVTLRWLARRLSEKDDVETKTVEREMPDGEPLVKTLRPEQTFARRWDSDTFYNTEQGYHPLDRVTSFRLELEGSEVSATDAETMSQPHSIALGDASCASSVSLSCPESQFCSRYLLGLQTKKDVEEKLPQPSTFLAYCCCMTRKVLPVSSNAVYEAEPDPLYLVEK